MEWLAMLLIPIAWVWQTFTHESSHLITAQIRDRVEAKGLWVFPHWLREEPGKSGADQAYRYWRPWELWKKPWDDCRFVFARVAWYPAIKHEKHNIVHFAPNIGAAVNFVIALALMPLVGVFSLPFMFAAIIDALWWWRGYFWGKPTSDGQKWKRVA